MFLVFGRAWGFGELKGHCVKKKLRVCRNHNLRPCKFSVTIGKFFFLLHFVIFEGLVQPSHPPFPKITCAQTHTHTNKKTSQQYRRVGQARCIRIPLDFVFVAVLLFLQNPFCFFWVF